VHRRPTPSTHRHRAVATAVALAGSVLVGSTSWTPAGAQEVEPAEVPPTTTPPPSLPVAEPHAAPPVAKPAVEAPAAEVRVELPAAARKAPPVRSGYAVDVPARPARELPLAPDVGSSPVPVPDVPEPPDREPSRRRPSDTSTGDASRTSPGTPARTPSGTRSSGTPVPASAPPPEPTQHTVIAGEHLWSIAASQVAAATGRATESVSAVEVAPYWTQLCMLNEARLRSGDLNVVYAGEVLDLPAR
jgi:hypothetical protein